MANYVSVMVDTDLMEQGKFYELVVDSNDSTVLFPKVTIRNYEFIDVQYFECPEPYDNFSSFQIWKAVKTNGEHRFENITNGVRVLKIERDGNYYIAFESNQKITGHIIFA